MEIYKRLQELTINKKIDQAEISRALKVSPATISKWWNGKRIPNDNSLARLAAYFNCDLNWLKTGEGFKGKTNTILSKIQTFGSRLKTLRISQSLSQQQVADATIMSRSRISELEQDKVENPRDDTIERLAIYFNTTQEWLKYGVTSNWNHSVQMHNSQIPNEKRLKHLCGTMSLASFAEKCDIPEATMSAYLQGQRIDHEDCYKIAKACQVSLGWLTCGESWISPNKKYSGFTTDKHVDTSRQIRYFEKFINKLSSDLEFSFPLTGELSRPLKNALDCKESLRELKSNLEENLFIDHPEDADTKIYYGRDNAPVTADFTAKSKDLDPKQSDMVKWIASQDDGRNYWAWVEMEFSEKFPEYRKWLKEKQDAAKEKNSKTGTDC